MTFYVVVHETTSRTFAIEAETPEEAKEIWEASDESDLDCIDTRCHDCSIQDIKDEKGDPLDWEDD